MVVSRLVYFCSNVLDGYAQGFKQYFNTERDSLNFKICTRNQNFSGTYKAIKNMAA